MTEIPLDHVNRDAGVEQAGGLGVPETVGPLEVDHAAGAVADPEPAGQFGERLVKGRRHVGPVGIAVEQQPEEQVARPCARCGVLLEPGSSPFLLFPDDRDDLGVDGDGVGGAVDLGLLVAQPGDQGPGACCGLRSGTRRQQRVRVQQKDLADPAAEPGLQHRGPHRLGIIQPAVGGTVAEQADASHDLRHRAVVDDVEGRVSPARAGKLPDPPEPGMLGPQLPPGRVARDGRGLVPVVVHEQVELLNVHQDRLGVRCRDRLPRGGPAAGPARLHVAQEVQHQVPDPGRIGVQPRAADAAAGEKGLENGQGEHPGAEGGPAQQPGFQGDLAVPLRGPAQPPGRDPVEVEGLAALRLVQPDRDPGVLHRVP